VEEERGADAVRVHELERVSIRFKVFEWPVRIVEVSMSARRRTYMPASIIVTGTSAATAKKHRLESSMTTYKLTE